MFECTHLSSCTVYYTDQQMPNIYIYVIFYISQALLHVLMHLHHVQEVLTSCFAYVTKLLKLQISKIIIIQQRSRKHFNILILLICKFNNFLALAKNRVKPC